jgi:AcrR family transcriptional regulator
MDGSLMRRIPEIKEDNSRVVQLFTDAKLLPNDDNNPGLAQHGGDQKQIMKQSDGIDNYHLLIDAAERLYGKFGFTRVTVRDIAGEVHMSASNVYRFFPARAEIAAAVCKKLLGKIEAEAEKVALSSTDSAAKRIRNLISAVHETHHKQNIHDRNLHKLVEAATAEKWSIIGEHNRRMTAIIEQIIANGIAEGEFRPWDASLAAHLIKTACIRFCDPRLGEDDDQKPEPTLDQMIDFCVSALAGKAP